MSELDLLLQRTGREHQMDSIINDGVYIVLRVMNRACILSDASNCSVLLK